MTAADAVRAMTVATALVWDEHRRADIYSVRLTYGQGPKDYMLSRGSKIIGWFDAPEDAQLFAQSHHEAATRAALNPEVLGLLEQAVEAMQMVSDAWEVSWTNVPTVQRKNMAPGVAAVRFVLDRIAATGGVK